MRHITWFSTVVGSLAALALPAYAQPQTGPSVVVTFSPYFSASSAAPVPIGPLALCLSVLAIGLAIWMGRRKGANHWLSLPALAALLVGLGLSQPQGSQAVAIERLISLESSPTRITIESEGSERIVVRNDTAQALRLDGLHLEGASDELRLFASPDAEGQACQAGLMLDVNATCVIEVVQSTYFSLAAGDVVKVQLNELHPTQPSVGFDQIYYHLARKQPDLDRFSADSTHYARQLQRTELKRANDYCEDTGRAEATDHVPRTVSLVDGIGFRCTVSEADADAGKLKTVVVGPNGQLYLTDGHHTFTTLWELSDGGPQLPVLVRVVDNFSDAATLPAFWARMQANQYVWLFDADGQAITYDQLPDRLGLDVLRDDPYRSLVYLTRDLGYENAGVKEFAEFYWGFWLRAQGLDLNAYDLSDLSPSKVIVNGSSETEDPNTSSSSYVAAVRDAALLMRQAPSDVDIYPGVLPTEVGQNTAALTQKKWDDTLKEEVWQSDARESDGRYENAGKAWFANGYRACGGAPAEYAQCWRDYATVIPVIPLR